MKRSVKTLIVLILTVSMLAGFALPVQATELKTGIGVVTASSLRLRAKPSTEAEILGNAYSGDMVVIIREVGDWYLVNCNLEIGYMAKEYIEFNDVKNIKLGYAMFDCSTNVRSGPGTDNEIVAQAPKGETCFIVGFNRPEGLRPLRPADPAGDPLQQLRQQGQHLPRGRLRPEREQL